MKRFSLAVGMFIGLLAGLIVVAPGGASQPVSSNALEVVAREGECVQFAHVSYIRGMTVGSVDPVTAVVRLGTLELSPGIDAPVSAAAMLRPRPGADGEVILELEEDGSIVAAFRAVDLGSNQWVVPEYEYSGPCTMDH